MLVARWLLPAMAVAIRGTCVLLHIIRLLISAYTPVPPLANLSTRSGEHSARFAAAFGFLRVAENLWPTTLDIATCYYITRIWRP